ncbi:MAG: caspase family protein [Methylocella sp.]
MLIKAVLVRMPTPELRGLLLYTLAGYMECLISCLFFWFVLFVFVFPRHFGEFSISLHGWLMKIRWTMRGWFRLSRAVLTVALAISVFVSVPGQARRSEGGGQMRALIMGIDEYRYVSPLKGAAADARDIEATLRALGIADLKLMLNDEGDRATTLLAFDSLLARTNPEDTIFVALAGRSALEPERVKGSEPDGMDTVFLLAGFDPRDRQRASEKILHSEFNHFIKGFEDKGARVVFVADTCSGDGLTRDVDSRAQEMSYRSVSYKPIGDQLQAVSTHADAFLSPSDFRRSILLAATDKHSKVPEIRIPGAGYRGALSYAVARAFEGAADLNGDGRLTTEELLSYVRQVTYQLTDGRQQVVTVHPAAADPKKDVLLHFSRGISVQPVGQAGAEAKATIQIGGVTLVPVPEAPSPPPAEVFHPIPKIKDPIRVASLDGQSKQLAGLMSHAAYDVVSPNTSPDLVWDPSTHDVVSGGDVVAFNADRDDLSGIIDRMAAIRWLKLRSAKAPQEMKVFPNDKLHRTGEQVEIAIHGLAGRSLILFNIAGDGTLQFIYPKGSDPPIIANSEHRITLQVREPFGADQIVSVSATQRQAELEQAIRQLDRQRNPLKAAELVERYDGADVWVGLIGLFTAP